MRLDEFKLAALAKSEGMENEIKIVEKEEGESYSYYILTTEYNGSPMYFDIDIEIGEKWTFAEIYEEAEFIINQYKQAMQDPNPSYQYEYLMRQTWLVYTDRFTRHRGIFGEKVKEKLENIINELIEKNGSNFEKTYEEFINNYSKEELLYDI